MRVGGGRHPPYERGHLQDEGTAPSKAAIQSYIDPEADAQYRTMMKVIAYYENRGLGGYVQFDEDGFPLRSDSKDYGIMQINGAEYLEAWNWKTNIVNAYEILLTKEVEQNASIAGQIKKVKNAKGTIAPPTAEQLRVDLYNRYNSGKAIKKAVLSDPKTKTWTWVYSPSGYAKGCLAAEQSGAWQ